MKNNDINILGQQLKVIQNQVIGLFRPRFYPTDQYIPVIANDNGNLTCIEIGTLLGMSTLHIGSTSGRYVPFPELYWFTQKQVDKNEPSRNCTLTDMMQHPIEFSKWYKDNIFDNTK